MVRGALQERSTTLYRVTEWNITWEGRIILCSLLPSDRPMYQYLCYISCRHTVVQFFWSRLILSHPFLILLKFCTGGGGNMPAKGVGYHSRGPKIGILVTPSALPFPRSLNYMWGDNVEVLCWGLHLDKCAYLILLGQPWIYGSVAFPPGDGIHWLSPLLTRPLRCLPPLAAVLRFLGIDKMFHLHPPDSSYQFSPSLPAVLYWHCWPTVMQTWWWQPVGMKNGRP